MIQKQEKAEESKGLGQQPEVGVIDAGPGIRPNEPAIQHAALCRPDACEALIVVNENLDR